MTDSGSIEGILETAIYVDDLDAAERFYGDVLGLAKISRMGNRHAFFRCGAGVLLLFNPDETVKPPPADALPVPPHGAHGQGHLCFRLPHGGFETMIARLAAAGTAIESDFQWPQGGRSIYFRDPAGNSLECAEAAIWGLQ